MRHEGDIIEQTQDTVQTPKVTMRPVRKLNTIGRIKARIREFALAVLGLCVFAAGFAMGGGSLLSVLLVLAGVSIVAFAIMFWFFTPSRELSSDVCDAMAVANSRTINGILAAIPVKSSGIYVPSGQIGRIKVFLLFTDIAIDDVLPEAIGNRGISVVETARTKGVYVTPPGEGLLDYARSIGATFYPEGLEKEMRETMVSGLELARDIHVRQDGDRVSVALYDITNQGLCQELRKDDQQFCTRLGCPICSFAACMVAESMGRKARVSSVDVSGNEILMTYDLL